MKFEPVEVSDLVPFSPTLNFANASKASKPSFGGICKNGLWMWIVHDTTINMYHTENSEWLGGYCFGESLKNPTATITSVTEFNSSHITFPCLLIAVSHDHESLICMYDINTSKVVRSILLPDLVLTIEVISGNGGACVDTLHLFMQLRYMFGIIAVGTSTGHVYFLDLCLDEDFICNENLPNITFVVRKYELLPERRECAISRQQHIFMLLNDQSVHNGSFEFESRNSSLGYFPHGKVNVTALKYIQSTVSLAIGFNFGGIQIWDLQDLCLLYTISNQPQQLPIISFAFQEPENDPRNFCYLWVIRGPLSKERPEDFCTAAMYSLIYDQRTYVESFGYLYTEMRNCIKRFEYRMTCDPFSVGQSSSSVGSCLLSCQTICQTDEFHLDVFSTNDSDTSTENMSLCFLSWAVWSNIENTPMSYHLAVFDLNQWYRAEMPSSNFRCDPTYLNPYFAHFTFKDVAQILDLKSVLGLYAIPHSIKKFRYVTPSEEFFFPASLDFRTLLFSSNGIFKATFMGVQKRLLYEIAEMGPNAMINPKEFTSDLIRCGLIQDSHSTPEKASLMTQRETLLQLILEYHLPFFFMKCLKEWKYADSIQEGCTSRALLNWAWRKILHIKNSIDKLTLPLFNCSGCDVDKSSLKYLYSYRRQLDLIDSIFMGYQKFATPRTEQGIQELKCMKDAVFSINTYLQVILWLRSVRVLPEVTEGEETERNVIYPVNALCNSYLKRRNHLQRIHGSIGATDILLIDGLVKENFSENTWPEKGGNGIYPPPSIYAALSCYLLDDVHLELKHSLMYYVLLDICNASQNANNPLLKEVKKFPSVFWMPQSTAKLVKAFWYLDQFNFEVAIKKLLHPSVKAADILPWQHHRVIKSLLYQREARKALKYINHMEPPENNIEDVKLHLSVLLARGAVLQAFNYQRNKQGFGFGTELLNHLFLGCQEMHKLKDLMYMPLNSLESSILVKFLSENDDPRAQEALVIYHLLRCNFFEASKINEKLGMSLAGSSGSQERTAARDALVEGLLASVPKAEKNLVEEISRIPSVAFQKIEPLKPLSLSIKTAPFKQVTYSDILNSLISGASSAMNAPYLDPQTPLRSLNRSCFENIPFLRPPLTPEPTKISQENFHSTPVTKRVLTSPSSEFSSPSKRSRLLDNAPFRTPLSKKKVPKHLMGDVATLLQSPPIPRRSSKQNKDVLTKYSSTIAPQGILKKKVEATRFPISDLYTSETPSVLSDAGEDSDDMDKDDMIVDEVYNDVPTRQIRFSVPNKEDISICAISNMDTQSPSVSTVPTEPADFLECVEESKPLPPLELFDSEFINVSRRHAALGLTREPLKTYPRELPKEHFLTRERSAESTKLATSFSQQVPQLKLTAESEQCADDIDSDSCQTVESASDEVTFDSHEETKKCESEIPCTQSSSHGYSSGPQLGEEVKELDLECRLNASRSEPALNRSGSSSGNSSYNSASSERSFIITPRKPLRDNSGNTSLPEIVTVQGCYNEVMPASDLVMNIDDDDDDVCDVSDEDISIIGVVEAPLPQTMLTFNRPDESSRASQHISDTARTDEECEEIQIVSSSVPEDERFVGSVDFFKEVEMSNDQQQQNLPDNAVDDQQQKLSDDDYEQQQNLPDNAVDDQQQKLSDDDDDDEQQQKLSDISVDYDQQEDKLSDCDGNQQQQMANIQNQNSIENVEHMEIPDQSEFLSGNIVELMEDSSKTSSSGGESVVESNVNVQNKHFSDAEIQLDKLPKDSSTDVHAFAKDTNVITSPTYVPIKERISKNLLSVSEMSNFDDDDDCNEEPYSSLLLDVFRKDRSNVLEDTFDDHSSVKAIRKLETIAESSHTADTDSLVAKSWGQLPSASSLTLNKNSSQRLSEHFDFLSKNSDFYENNKLYKEAMNLLKDNSVLEIDTEKKSSRKTRTYVFGKYDETDTRTKITDSKSSKSKTNKEASSSKEFLESWHPETYEQFSNDIQKGKFEEDHLEALKSSPNVTVEKSSILKFNDESEPQMTGTKDKKKHESTKKVSAVGKKAKGKAKKMEFSFAEPTSPAGPEILEALSTPSNYPVGSFMFSPPLTRGMLRKKKMDESLGSSFASVASDASFLQTKKPPVDPILEEIIADKALNSKKSGTPSKSKTKSSVRKKIGSKKSTKTDFPHIELSDSSINVSALVETDSPGLSTSKVLSSVKPMTTTHRMTLRQTKSKSHTVQLF